MTLRPLIHPPADWLDDLSARRFGWVTLVTAVGLMIYGFTLGCWRSPLMGAFVAVKFPLLIVLTLCCNALLNACSGCC